MRPSYLEIRILFFSQLLNLLNGRLERRTVILLDYCNWCCKEPIERYFAVWEKILGKISAVIAGRITNDAQLMEVNGFFRKINNIILDFCCNAWRTWIAVWGSWTLASSSSEASQPMSFPPSSRWGTFRILSKTEARKKITG